LDRVTPGNLVDKYKIFFQESAALLFRIKQFYTLKIQKMISLYSYIYTCTVSHHTRQHIPEPSSRKFHIPCVGSNLS